MDVALAYDQWSEQYDTNENKTRDLEGFALRTVLSALSFERSLEIGCGTGKNTEWLVQKAAHVTAVDLSQKMLAVAKEKIQTGNVQFMQADINAPWDFVTGTYDLVSFSLVLEHIEHLEPVLQSASKALNPGGYLYMGELHPLKQYSGSKARFETAEGPQVVNCFTHHLSHFTSAAKSAGLAIEEVQEFFDDNAANGIPRILALLFTKK